MAPAHHRLVSGALPRIFHWDYHPLQVLFRLCGEYHRGDVDIDPDIGRRGHSVIFQ